MLARVESQSDASNMPVIAPAFWQLGGPWLLLLLLLLLLLPLLLLLLLLLLLGRQGRRAAAATAGLDLAHL
jgi:hypothetical protein